MMSDIACKFYLYFSKVKLSYNFKQEHIILNHRNLKFQSDAKII